MKASKLYALTPRQAFLVQHAIVTHEMHGPRLSRTQRKALSDAWQSLSRPIWVRPVVARTLKRKRPNIRRSRRK